MSLGGGPILHHSLRIHELTGSGAQVAWETKASGAPPKTFTLPYDFEPCRSYEVEVQWRHVSPSCPGHSLITTVDLAGANPPDQLEAWWPGDDTAENFTSSLHHGTWMQSPTLPALSGSYASGMVDRAFAIDGGTDFVAVPDHDGLDFEAPGAPVGGENLTIDAWVYNPPGAPDSRQPIVNKIVCLRAQAFAGEPDCQPQTPGYLFEMETTSGLLTLRLLMSDGAQTTVSESVPFDYSQAGFGWRFVAVSVDRSVPGSVAFYVDGTFLPCSVTSDCSAPTGSLANSVDLRIGADEDYFNAGAPHRYHEGRIDELELFRRVVSNVDLYDLYDVAECGKCQRRFEVTVPRRFYVCAGSATTTTTIKVCNESDIGQQFDLTNDPTHATLNQYLPGVCSPADYLQPADVSFRDNGYTVNSAPYRIEVGATECVSVVTDFDATGIVSPGDTLCYGIRAEAASGDGYGFDVGQIEGIDCTGGWGTLTIGSDQVGSALMKLPGGGTSPAWSVSNMTGVAGSADWRLESVPIGREGGAAGLSLGGMPEGDPVMGTLSLGPGQSANVSTSVALVEYRPEDLHRFVFSLDIDQDGTFDLVSDQLLEGVLSSKLCPAGFDHDRSGTLTAGDLAGLIANLGSVNDFTGFPTEYDYDNDDELTAADLAIFNACLAEQAGTLVPGTSPSIGPIPDRDDLDLDGVPDVSDNCPGAFNPFQEDADSDTIGDACEVAASDEHLWMSVSDAPNPPDANGAGTVYQDFEMAKLEVTNQQYTAFLNSVAASDTYGLYNADMELDPAGGIERSGTSGSYTYAVKNDFGDLPVNFVSFWDAIRYANWLANGRPVGPQDASTTEDGSYLITVPGVAANSIVRKTNADFVVPSRDEWYKAAFYDGAGGYFDYPAGSDTAVVCAAPAPVSDTANCGGTVGSPTRVGDYTSSESPYGINDQGGNVWEWNETVSGGTGRIVRGGGFYDPPAVLTAAYPETGLPPATESEDVGFRVARSCVPEPGFAAGLFAGLAMLAWLSRGR